MYLTHINKLQEGLNELIVDEHKFFIYKDKEKIKIYDSICPHQGATLHCNKRDKEWQNIYCKVHNWQFNAQNGESYNIKNAKLFTHNARVDLNGDIYLDNYILKQSNITPPPPQIIIQYAIYQ